MAKPPPLRSQHALALYRWRAWLYDCELAAVEPVRRQAIDALALGPGDTVLDVGCGTGLSFAALRRGVGPTGRVLGVEQCPEMIEQARRRVVDQGWSNVDLWQTCAQALPDVGRADAALFHFTHDILTSADALQRVMRQLKPGARVVAAGLCWGAPWDWVTNTLVWGAALYSVTNLSGLACPWALLAPYCDAIERELSALPGTFVVRTRVRTGSDPGGC